VDDERSEAGQVVKATQVGFTLVELLLVVAIVGILAAIGIPQLTRYRVRAYNASALTDIQTARTAEQAVFVNKQQYASTAGTGCSGDPICTGAIAFGVGGGIDIVLRPGSALEVSATPTSYTATTKNVRGDRVYCVDSDSSFIRYAIVGVNVPLAAPYRAPSPNPKVDDCAANFPVIQ